MWNRIGVWDRWEIGYLKSNVLVRKWENILEAYHTSPHKLSPSPANDPVTHLATKRWQHERFVVQCCFDYFNRKIVRAIFNWVSKVIRDCIGFALLRSVIGLENSRHPLKQSDAKVKPIATWSLAFSRAWDRLRVFTLSSHWFVMIFILVLIGRCDYFGFGFSTLDWKLLYWLGFTLWVTTKEFHLLVSNTSFARQFTSNF